MPSDKFTWSPGDIRPVTGVQTMDPAESTLFSEIAATGILYEKGFYYESPVYAQFDLSLFMLAPGGLVSLRRQGNTSRVSVTIKYIESAEDIYFDDHGRLHMVSAGAKRLTADNAGFIYKGPSDAEG